MTHLIRAIAVTATVAMASPAIAEQATKPVQTGQVVIAATDTLNVQAQKLCKAIKARQYRVILSKNAANYCNGDMKYAPKLIKSGKRFSNRGTGAEFNVLTRNLHLFVK